MYLNGEGIEVLHQPAAHSDGDAIVFFRRSDVVVAGDVLDTTRFPVIDVARGGSIDGEIAALNRLVDLAIPSVPIVSREEGTLVIPGHGRVCDQLDVVEYRDMVTIVRDRVRDLIRAGATLDQVKAAAPARGYTRRYGADTGSVDDQRLHRGGLSQPGAGRSRERARSADGVCHRSSALAVDGRARRLAPGSRRRPPPTARASAPIDLTGYWVSVVTEDWRFRMVTPRKGDYGFVPMTPDARKVADAWDPAADAGGGQPVQGLWRRRDHARARPAAHHLAGRRDVERRDRCRDADAAVSVRSRGRRRCRRRPGRETRSRSGSGRRRRRNAVRLRAEG